MTNKFSEDETRNKEMTLAYKEISKLLAKAVQIAERFDIPNWSSVLAWAEIAINTESSHVIRDAMMERMAKLTKKTEGQDLKSRPEKFKPRKPYSIWPDKVQP